MQIDPKQAEIKDDRATLKINPKIYALDVIYSAAYILIDKAFIILDGDPETTVIVEIIKNDEKQEIIQIVKQFYDELLNYSVYKAQMEKTAGIREIILKRALLTNEPEHIKQQAEAKNQCDPKGIMKTWEEKNGQMNKCE